MKIDNIISSDLCDVVESNFNSGKYTNSIVDAMLHLSNVLREKSNLESDGVKLVNEVFSKKDPKIKVTKLETETDKNVQEGIGNILRGLYQLIRNPRHHEKIDDSERDAIQVIAFIDYILQIIEKSKSKFEINDFERLIFDDQFVEGNEYATLLVERIPRRKLYEVLIRIYRNKQNGDIYNLEQIFNAIFSRLDEGEIESYMQIISSDLLKTNDDHERKFIFRSFPAEYWNRIDKISKIRTENRIISSIKEGKYFTDQDTGFGWLATWCDRYFEFFSLKDELMSTVGLKISSNDLPQIAYCFKYIMNSIWKVLDIKKLEELLKKKNSFLLEIHYSFLAEMRHEIEKGNTLFYNYIRSRQYLIPDVLHDYFNDSIENFKEDEKLKSLADANYPEFEYPGDDLPF